MTGRFAAGIFFAIMDSEMMIMLEWNVGKDTQVTWNPPALREEELTKFIFDNIAPYSRFGLRLLFLKTEPYIDMLMIAFRDDGPDRGEDPESIDALRRFVFREQYVWSPEEEQTFQEFCLNNQGCFYSHEKLDEIYRYYSGQYPQWHLKRYYTQDMRLLDHIYQCCRQNTAKEILYKAGLDELAAGLEDLDEENLLATSPSTLFEGISMRCLRALNCREGAKLLMRKHGRDFVKGLAKHFPEMFTHPLNDAQGKYLAMLIRENLTIGEAGRLFMARRLKLLGIWNHAQYDMFWRTEEDREVRKKLSDMDPIYREFLDRMTDEDFDVNKYANLKSYLLQEKVREHYDREIRRSNRRRNPDWQERGEKYLIRYPQTINDFCREAVYMRNCLFGYVDAMVDNTTTILFMRRTDQVNLPFITLEIFENQLKQAYHRFNVDCSKEEEEWIKAYCKRHGIDSNYYYFDRQIDLNLM